MKIDWLRSILECCALFVSLAIAKYYSVNLFCYTSTITSTEDNLRWRRSITSFLMSTILRTGSFHEESFH
jgi:hypothetical protein